MTSSLSTAKLLASYSASLSASGGNQPYTWSIASGKLPAGLSLIGSTGRISGSPTQSGSFAFTAKVVDSSSPLQIATQALTLTVSSTGGKVQVGTTWLPGGYVSQSYSGQFTALGGTPGYTWQVSSGQLPSGLTVSGATGAITGTPSSTGSYNFTVQVTDSSSPPQTASASMAVVVQNFPQLDQYGGIVTANCSNGMTGFFDIEKAGTRWTLCSPDGHPFWLLGVFGVSSTGADQNYLTWVTSKYGGTDVFATQALKRLQAWGFNTVGGYSNNNELPIGSYGGQGNLIPMPFVRMLRTASNLKRILVKDIVYGTDSTEYTGFRGGSYPDVYDPEFATDANNEASGYDAQGVQAFAPGELDATPYLIGTYVGDEDYFWGLRRGSDANDGWLVAVTAPTQTSNTNYGVTYTDTTVYTKLAWRDYLEAKYNQSLQLLNSTWGSNYTSWNSAGGWPKHLTGGTGLLDEDGSSPWLHTTDYGKLSNLSPSVVADLNGFLSSLVDKTFSVLSSAIRTATPHHLVIGPDALSNTASPLVLQAMAPYVDAFEIQTYSTTTLSALQNSYGAVQKPILAYVRPTAQADSPWASYPPNTADDFPTQAARGQGYAGIVQQLFSFQGSDGMNPVIGLNFWTWADNPSEKANFGLVSSWHDNAYNGKEAIIALGYDPWGFLTGSEVANYGDFLDAVLAANQATITSLSAIP